MLQWCNLPPPALPFIKEGGWIFEIFEEMEKMENQTFPIKMELLAK